jgi:hypothetical protein
MGEVDGAEGRKTYECVEREALEGPRIGIDGIGDGAHVRSS